jgi:hypothetical protein
MDEAREIRKQADANFLAGLDKLATDPSKPREMRERAASMAKKFRTEWYQLGRSGDPMTPEERVYFHTAYGSAK